MSQSILEREYEVRPKKQGGGMGLTSEEAAALLKEYGENTLLSDKKAKPLRIFLGQFRDVMVMILLIAAGISAFIGETADAVTIIIIVMLNAILGFIQEYRTEKTLLALKSMSAPSAKVCRDGHMTVIPASQLVPGDIISVEAGDKVAADAVLLTAKGLMAEESILTGESEPVAKRCGNTSDKDNSAGKENIIYSGTMITKGTARAKVIATGVNAQMGKISDMLTDIEDEETPLQKRLGELGKIVAIICIAVCFIVAGAGILKGEPVFDMLMTGITIAIAAIPEGLPATVTIALALAVSRMLSKNALVHKLHSVETLGCTSVICTDKTGTLTQNKMTVVDHTGDTALLASAMALCSDAVLNPDGSVQGEPTEAALVSFAAQCGLPKPRLEQDSPRIAEAPFDSGRKMMSTLHNTPDGVVQYTKGAPDQVLARCTHYWEGGQALPMTDDRRREILADNHRMAAQALRVLAAASRPWPHGAPEDQSPAHLEEALCFIGLTGMIDPVRPQVKPAIEECRQAGIRPDTAVAIARQLGILSDPSQAITGAALDALSDEELTQNVDRYSVYARVQPEHKVRIVSAWRRRGAVTAMTGDGVNDAPSIKSADIGIGMGITGTDVTKNVADMVLSDDNFATIVGAVAEGRRIYDNIRKAIGFLLASNMSEVLGVFFSALLGFTLLNPVHLLFINLITDCFPALALGMERPEPDIMRRPPRSAKDGIFSGGLGFDIAYQGILITVITMASYIIGHCMEAGCFEMPRGVSPHGMTMAFLTMSMCEIFHSFNMRSQRRSVFTLRGHNKVLWAAMLGSLLLTTVVLEVPPIANAFGFTPVSWTEYGIALALAMLVIPIVELVKLIQRRLGK